MACIKALTHAQNRSKVCLICFQKGSTMRSTESPQNLKRISEFFMENYDPYDLKMPNGLCQCCSKKLERMETKNSESTLPNPVDFSKLEFPASITRSRGGDLAPCSCDICEIATASVKKKSQFQ